MVYPEKEGRMVTQPLFFTRKCVNTVPSSHSVNSEDFLIAEEIASKPSRRHVAIFVEICFPDASANLASISSANLRRLRM